MPFPPIEYRRKSRLLGVTIAQQPSLSSSLWRYKWYVIAAAILAGLAGYGLSMLQDPVYRAEGTVLLNDARSAVAIAGEIGVVADTDRQIEIIESFQVAQRAADILADGITASQVQGATTATKAEDASAVTVIGSMPTGGEAAAVVDAVVAAYGEIVSEQVQTSANEAISTLQASLAKAEERIAELDDLIAEHPDDSTFGAQRIAAVNQLVALDTRIALLETNVVLYGTGVQLYVAPVLPSEPIQPRPKRTAAVASVFGAAAAGAWAWRRAEKNQSAGESSARVSNR